MTADLVRQVVADLDADRPADCRDAALLLVGFALAGRRSELVALEWSTWSSSTSTGSSTRR